MKHAITVQNLKKEFRHRGNNNVITGLLRPEWKIKSAVHGISFQVDRGESVAFLGPNGAGKTTTTKMLTGLMKPTDGVVKVLGYTPFSRDHRFLKRIGLVMGNKAGLNWDLTASQSFELLQKIYEIPLHDYELRVKKLTELLGVDHVLATQVRKLSLGERMKLELVGSLIHDPEVLFLDEPTIGLDLESKKNVREFLRSMHDAGKTIILTSHDMDDVAAVCDRVVFINKGSILFDGSMGLLTEKYSDKKYIALEFAGTIPPEQALLELGTIVSTKKNKIVISVEKNSMMVALAQINDANAVRDVTIESVPLEVMIQDLLSEE